MAIPSAGRARPALAILALLAGCATVGPSGPRTATATLRDGHGAVVGAATLTEDGGALRVVVEVRALAPGVHGVHVHEVGRCDPPTFTSAGGHFNPGRRQHGLRNPRGPHAGDLPNLTVGADGTGRLEVTTERLALRSGPTSLLDADGSALVVHGSPDDERTDPTGNAGVRAACGVIVGGGAAPGGPRAAGDQPRA